MIGEAFLAVCFGMSLTILTMIGEVALIEEEFFGPFVGHLFDFLSIQTGHSVGD